MLKIPWKMIMELLTQFKWNVKKHETESLSSRFSEEENVSEMSFLSI